MKTIFKYKLAGSDGIISLPDEAVVLSVDAQFGELFIWALVDTTRSLCERFFRVFATGQELQSTSHLCNLVFVGTVHIHGHSSLVFHVFEDMSVVL